MHASANTACMQALWVWGVDGSRMVYVGMGSKPRYVMHACICKLKIAGSGGN